MISTNKTRAVKKEVRTLLRALRMIGNPGLRTSPNFSPDPDRAAVLADAWRRERGLSMAVASLHRLQTRVPDLQPLLMQTDSPAREKRVRAMLEGWLRRYLPQRSDVRPRFKGELRVVTSEAIIKTLRGMTPGTIVGTFGARTWAELKMRLEQGVLQSQNAIRVVYGHTHRGATPHILVAHQGQTGYWIQTTDSKTGRIICAETYGNTFWTVVAAVIIGLIVAGIIELAAEEDWFNETDDDKARAEIAELNCQQIMQKDDAHWISLFDAMIAGPTGDEDENAMLKVLNCVPCDRVQTIVANYGVQDLMDEFNGTEWDELVIRLQKCGLLTFHDWDDDATRKFIGETPDSKLAALSIADIVTLCKNLFDGSCGDEDEEAIIRLMKVQDPCKVQNILVHHISADEFDDNVDGEEWEELSQILIAASPPFTICP